MLRDLLRREGHRIWRKRVRTVMARMGIDALSRTPTTSRDIRRIGCTRICSAEITRSNHVWAADSTYIPTTRGCVYFFAVLDWASRRVLAWRLSNTLTTDCCIEAVQAALWPAMALLTSSTPTKAASSPARSSRGY